MTAELQRIYERKQEISPESPFAVLFVCLGNICRSPTAEGIFIHAVKQRGLEKYFLIDSAGTAAWHTGEGADPRSQQVANGRGIHLPSKARQAQREDFIRFDLILAMEKSNLDNLQTIKPSDSTAVLMMMRAFDAEVNEMADVPDPYYGGPRGFHDVFDMLERSSNALLDEIEAGFSILK